MSERKSKSNIPNAIVSVFIAILTILSLFSAFVLFRYTDVDSYLENILNDEYDSTVNAGIRDIFQTQTSIVAFPEDELMNQVDMNSVLQLSRSYTTDFFDAIIGGKKFEPSDEDYIFKSTKLRSYIETELRRSITESQQEATEEAIEKDVEDIYMIYEDGINNYIRYIPNRVVSIANDRISPVFAVVKKLAKPLFAGSVILFAVAIALSVVINRNRSFNRKAFRMFAPIFVGSSLLLGPYTVFYFNNIIEKFRILNSALIYAEIGVYKNLIELPFYITLGITLFSFAMILYALIKRELKKRKIRQHRHRDRDEEEYEDDEVDEETVSANAQEETS